MGADLALNVKVEAGQTLRLEDKQRILNSIAERDLSLPPELKHANYNKYNQRLRAMLALGFWRRVMMGAGEQAEIGTLQSKVAAAIKGDEWRTTLNISMAYMSGGDVEEKIGTTAKNLPAHLKHLTLDLRGNDVQNDVLKEMASLLPRELESFDLNLSGNPKIENVGVETMVTKLPPSLIDLKINLEGTSTTKELADKRNNLDGLKQHIIDEAEKGNWCTYHNLCPAPTGRMTTNLVKFKHMG